MAKVKKEETYKQLKERLEGKVSVGAEDEDIESQASETTTLVRGASKGKSAKADLPEAKAKGEHKDDKDRNDIGDVSVMLALSSLVYTIAALRDHARNTNRKAVIDEENDREKYQLLVGDYNFVGGNQIASDGDVPAHHLSIAVLENILEEDCNGSEEFTDELTYRCMQMLKKATKKYNAFVNNFDAAHNTYELVYAITAMIPPGSINGPPQDPNTREPSQVSVVFRGSSTLNDWLHNAQFIPARLNIRFGDEATNTLEKAWLVESATGNGETIPISPLLAKKLQERLKELAKNQGDPDVDGFEVHAGFLKYLFTKQTSKSKDSSEDLSKYESIKWNLIKLMNSSSCSTCELKVTGHSLGGALSSLCSFLLACDTEVWDTVRTRGGSSCKYITCISFAAPHVGGEGYQVAHDLLLDEMRLKHLRVTTDRDFVPVGVPLVSPGLRQTGLNMHLGPRPGLRIGLFGLFSFQPVIGTWLCWLPRFYWQPRTSINKTKDILKVNTLTKGIKSEWPRLEILGLISTTYPIIWLLAYSFLVHGFIFLLPLPLSAWMLQQPWYKYVCFFDKLCIGSLAAWQTILLIVRKPLQVFGLGSKWITHSLSEYYKNLLEDNKKKRLTSSKVIFEDHTGYNWKRSPRT